MSKAELSESTTVEQSDTNNSDSSASGLAETCPSCGAILPTDTAGFDRTEWIECPRSRCDRIVSIEEQEQEVLEG